VPANKADSHSDDRKQRRPISYWVKRAQQEAARAEEDGMAVRDKTRRMEDEEKEREREKKKKFYPM